MIVYYNTLLYHEHNGFLSHHKEGEVKGYRLSQTPDFCCEDIKAAFKARAIGFGDDYDEDNNGTVKDLGINIITGRSMGRSGTEYTFYKIKFCPFCSKSIELKEIEEDYVNKPEIR
jgi:hypothetical protein